MAVSLTSCGFRLYAPAGLFHLAALLVSISIFLLTAPATAAVATLEAVFLANFWPPLADKKCSSICSPEKSLRGPINSLLAPVGLVFVVRVVVVVVGVPVLVVFLVVVPGTPDDGAQNSRRSPFS